MLSLEFNLFFAIFLIVAAPFAGSFLGLAFNRMPNRQSVVWGRSRCDHCHVCIPLQDLLPVIGWLRLAGRCRRCGAEIGLAPLAFELAALLIAVWALSVLPTALVVPGFCLGLALLLLSATDAVSMRLPDILTLPLIPAGIAVNGLLLPERLIDSIAGAATGFGVLCLIAGLYRILRGRLGLGFGDVKLYSAAGAWVGWQGLPFVMLIAAAGGLIFVLALLVRGEANIMRRAFPFGPFLAMGFWLVWLYWPALYVGT